MAKTRSYDVTVGRSEHSCQVFTVRAGSPTEARDKALELARDDMWEEQGEVDYNTFRPIPEKRRK